MPQDTIEIQVVTSLAMVAQSDWDSCACPETGSGKDPRSLDPFTTYRFLWALETSGSVGEATGWQPYFLLAFQKKIFLSLYNIRNFCPCLRRNNCKLSNFFSFFGVSVKPNTQYIFSGT